VQHPLPEVCDQCGATLAVDQAVLADERRQVFDLPRMGYEVTAALSWYGVHDRRGQTVMDDFGILPRFAGVAVHDGWAPYKDYACTHALCNAHHLRELVFLAETTGQAWPQQMIELLCAAKTETDQARQGQSALTGKRLRYYRRRYETILAAGERLNPEAVRIERRRGRVKQSAAPSISSDVCADTPTRCCVSSTIRVSRLTTTRPSATFGCRN